MAVSSFGEFPAPFTKIPLFEYLRANMFPLSSIFSLIPCLKKINFYEHFIATTSSDLRGLPTPRPYIKLYENGSR